MPETRKLYCPIEGKLTDHRSVVVGDELQFECTNELNRVTVGISDIDNTSDSVVDLQVNQYNLTQFAIRGGSYMRDKYS